MHTAALAQSLARSCSFYFVGSLNWDPAVMDSKPAQAQIDTKV
jgi:hypothetical protein